MTEKKGNDFAPEAASRPDLILTREFAAPRNRVFRAWIDAKQLAKWWGPKGFTNPVCEADPRPGGAIRIEMRSPGGKVYPMSGAFNKIVEPEFLEFSTASALDERGEPKFTTLCNVTFEERNGRTKVTLRIKVTRRTPETEFMENGQKDGWTQSLDRLAELAAKA